MCSFAATGCLKECYNERFGVPMSINYGANDINPILFESGLLFCLVYNVIYSLITNMEITISCFIWFVFFPS